MSKNARSFFMSMGITVCLLVLLSGMLYVDYQTRRIGFGDSTPVVSIVENEDREAVRFYALGADASIDGSWLKWLLEQSGTQAQTICNMARELWDWTLDVFTKESRLRIPGVV